MQKVSIADGPSITNYRYYASMVHQVDQFLGVSQEPIEKLKGHTVWMINSTAVGGGVAEMLPSQMRLLRELGLSIEWLVIEANDKRFFNLTKRIHNAIHGSGDGIFTEVDREIYHDINEKNVEPALSFIQDGDIVVIHDPQPMPLAGMIRKVRNVKLIWRCHIGIDRPNKVSENVWDFLSAYYDDYDQFVFSLEAYIPGNLKREVSLITPAIDPLSHKNRVMHIQKCIGIQHLSGITNHRDPLIYAFYDHQVRRVMPDGSFGPVNSHSDFELIYRPVITQISRWDRLKGFKELLDAFIKMKENNASKSDTLSLEYRRIKSSRLLLGGPDPAFVSDDPEGLEVLNELIEQYKGIDPSLQNDIAILLLPLDNQKENALIVNAIQSSSTIVVQNSLQEGFGLTATEAMWKQRPVLVSGAAGLVHQVLDHENGRINPDPKNTDKLAATMEEMLQNQKELDNWGFKGQVRVIEHFTVFTQLQKWLKLLTSSNVLSTSSVD
jgi:trehalose synthase